MAAARAAMATPARMAVVNSKLIRMELRLELAVLGMAGLLIELLMVMRLKLQLLLRASCPSESEKSSEFGR